MNKKVNVWIVLFLILAKSCTDNDSKSWEWGEKGIIENEGAIKIIHDGIEREYVLYIPSSYSQDSSAMPLVFNFHGGGGTATGHRYYSDLRPIADTANFIAVYPQGSLLSDGGGTHWNSAELSSSNKSTADDFGFINALIDTISSNYNVDLSKVYACGFSNGGDFALSLSYHMNERISAVASVAGLMIEGSGEYIIGRNVGIMMIHGTADDARPYEGINQYYQSVEETIEQWSSYGNTSLNSAENFIDLNGNNIERYQYSTDDGVVYIDLYKIINGDHYWFDLNINGVSTDRLIWNFLSNFELESSM